MEVLVTGDNEFLTARIRETVLQEGYNCPQSNVVIVYVSLVIHSH